MLHRHPSYMRQQQFDMSLVSAELNRPPPNRSLPLPSLLPPHIKGKVLVGRGSVRAPSCKSRIAMINTRVTTMAEYADQSFQKDDWSTVAMQKETFFCNILCLHGAASYLMLNNNDPQ